jgi:hypothetical protein
MLDASHSFTVWINHDNGSGPWDRTTFCGFKDRRPCRWTRPDRIRDRHRKVREERVTGVLAVSHQTLGWAWPRAGRGCSLLSRPVRRGARTLLPRFVRPVGIEPSSPAYRAGALPLSYRRSVIELVVSTNEVVPRTGVEPDPPRLRRGAHHLESFQGKLPRVGRPQAS